MTTKSESFKPIRLSILCSTFYLDTHRIKAHIGTHTHSVLIIFIWVFNKALTHQQTQDCSIQYLSERCVSRSETGTGMFRGLKLSLHFSRQQSLLKSRRQCLLVVYRKCLVGTTCLLFHNTVLHRTQKEPALTIQDSWRLRSLQVTRQNRQTPWKSILKLETDRFSSTVMLFTALLSLSVCVCVCLSVSVCPLEGKWQNKPELPTSWADWWADWFGCIIY